MTKKTIVTGGQQRSISRKLAELSRQVSQAKGYSHDPAALEEVLQHLNQFGPDSLLSRVAGKNCLGSATPGAETVTVPDLPAQALVALAHEAVGQEMDGETFEYYLAYAKTNLVRGERGKTYESLVWQPTMSVQEDRVRAHFDALGFCGNSPAFLKWIEGNHGDGWFGTVPPKERCLHPFRRECCPHLRAPFFSCDGAERHLSFEEVYGRCYLTANVFVAFREVLK